MEALISGLLDVVLALALMGLAWGALASVDLFKAIVLFIAFGLVMALVWVRLNAPDIALAEAAIGAGLTGALLLAAYAKLRCRPRPCTAIATPYTLMPTPRRRACRCSTTRAPFRRWPVAR